ncbi:hypothetical protein ACFVBP_10610 [Nocardioides sp. NPDC057764]|uniref:hypothetical protein n=1 Tax=Nocardioides sp. NPDC057764 TaxID=3346243 RepID=UPI00366ACA37
MVERQDIIASITAAADSGHPGYPRPQRRRRTPEQVAAAFEPPGLTDSERDQLRAWSASKDNGTAEPNLTGLDQVVADIVNARVSEVLKEVSQKVADQNEAYLHSPGLSQDWIAGWHSANHHDVDTINALYRDEVLAAKNAKLARQRKAFEELRDLEDELDQS